MGFLIRGGFSPPSLNHYVLIRRHYLFDRGVFLISGWGVFNSGGFSNQEWVLYIYIYIYIYICIYIYVCVYIYIYILVGS